MSYTASTGKLVGAFKGSNGEPVYVMFEQTYESNLYPRTPNWNAQVIGGLEAVIKRIFLSASSCEGGGLVGASGRPITAEGYIAGWMKELANPVQMDDAVFELAASSSWNSPIPESDVGRIIGLLKAKGADRIAAGLESGSVMASLHADHEALSVIYDGLHIGAWRIIKSYEVPLHGIRNPELGYKPAKAKVHSLDTPRFIKVREDISKHLMQIEDGSWRCVSGGYGYIYVGNFVNGIWRDELTQPGSYRNRIKAYREAIKNACVLPANAQIIVENVSELKDWVQRDIDGLITEAGHTITGGVVQINIPTDRSLLYRATDLPSEHTKWVFAESAPTEQLCLLAG